MWYRIFNNLTNLIKTVTFFGQVIGAYITSLARTEMYKAILKCEEADIRLHCKHFLKVYSLLN